MNSLYTSYTDHSFKSENDPIQVKYICPEDNPEVHDTELQMTLQDISRQIEDVVHEHIAEQGISSASPSYSIVNTTISSKATRISIFCSPMGASNQEYAEPSIYAIPNLPAVDEKLEGALHPCLTSTVPHIPRSDRHIDCATEEEEIVETDSTNFSSDRSRDLHFPLEAGQSISKLSHELDLQLSSPALTPSTPPTSSPPLASSRPSSPMDDPDNTVPKQSLTDLPNKTSSDPEDYPLGRGISESGYFPLKNGVVTVVSNIKFELDKLVQKEQKKVRILNWPDAKSGQN